MTRTGLLRRYPARDLWALAAALAGPVAAAAVLLPFRASWSNTNAALLLVVVVVAVTGEGYLQTMHGTAALAQESRSPEAVAEYVGGLLDLKEWRFEYGSLRSHPPRLDSDGSIVDGHGAWEVDQAGLPAELELRVFGNGQYFGRFLMRARPAVLARLVAVALAEQVRHAYSAARVSGSAR